MKSIKPFGYSLMGFTAFALLGASDLLSSDVPPGVAPGKAELLYASAFGNETNRWTVVSGDFRVESGLFRSRSVTAENKLSRAVIGDGSWRDCAVEARVKLEQAADPKADFGVIARYMDQNNYYMFLYKIEAKTLVIERKLKGKLKVLAETPIELGAGKWHDFKCTLTGVNLAVEVDGQKIAKVADDNFTSGGAGLLVYWADVSFARVNVYRAGGDLSDKE